MIYLSEAVHCEHDKAYGYEKNHIHGNQTGDELRTVPYYIRPFTFAFRPTDSNVANAIAIRMEQAVANKHIGYSQAHREMLPKVLAKDPDPSHVKTDVDCDCSSLMNTVAKITWNGIGHFPPMTGLERTAEMHRVYSAMPKYFEDITAKVNLKTGYGLQRGDIIFTPASHTACVVRSTTEINKKPLFVAAATKKTPVYLKSTGTKKQTAWHQLEVGNLCDVCDERKNRYYVRIGSVYGWVKKADLK